MQRNYVLFLKSLLPIPLYFIFTWLVRWTLSKYTVVGPVSATTGQPVFPSYPMVVFALFAVVMVAGLIYSLVQAKKNNGPLRYVSLAVVILFVPLELIFAFAAQISLFGMNS